MSLLTTPITTMLNIQHPILLAGMGHTSGAELAAAVSNAGGMGVIGGYSYTPAMLREAIVELKSKLRDSSLPFGVDLLLPKLGGTARKTNIDYTRGALHELIDIIIEGGAKLFVSAVGVPPKEVVDKLHHAGVLYMNMVGHPKHVHKACSVGADLICAQGGEAGGHTGQIPTSVLVPACADVCKNYKSPLTGEPVQLIAAGGIFDGRSIASAFMLGANAVWVGTRFVTARESGAPKAGKKALIFMSIYKVLDAGFDDITRTTIFTGRPLHALGTPYIRNWEQNRQSEIQELQSRGIIVLDHELDKLARQGTLTDEIIDQSAQRPMGYAAAMVNTADQSAAEIVLEMTVDAYNIIRLADRFTATRAKL